MGSRRIFPVGDYVPDELFDSSYEALLSLSSVIGEARSRATPEEVIASLENATYREWAREDSETRCPICLDDYEPSDIVAKLLECPHWLHKHCLEVSGHVFLGCYSIEQYSSNGCEQLIPVQYVVRKSKLPLHPAGVASLRAGAALPHQ
ncbi:hypothetical protein ID866_4564 [Astraeus odoratus]|nr:hypothetical protein ID866_4564 [Astraeus odoratus]